MKNSQYLFSTTTYRAVFPREHVTQQQKSMVADFEFLAWRYFS